MKGLCLCLGLFRRRSGSGDPGPATGDGLLLEDGFFLLLESGDFLLLE